MKKSKIMLCFITVIIALFITQTASFASGLSVTTGQTKENLANKLVGEGVTVSNVTFTGTSTSAGTFSGGTGIVGFENGIILSSGNASYVIGPNNSDSKGQSNGLSGDSGLTALAGVPTYDASNLQFDFVPTGGYISFQYVFSSEEYNEYANSTFTDTFAFYVNGVNYALIPGTQTPVSINNINGGNPFGTNAHNPQYFINNDLSDGGGSINTQMDGLTYVFSIQAPVNAGQVNHIKMAIADAGDSAYDSNVFIKANSINDRPAQPGKIKFGEINGNEVELLREDGTDGTISVDWTANDAEGTELADGTVIFNDGVSSATFTVPDGTSSIELSNPIGGSTIDPDSGNIELGEDTQAPTWPNASMTALKTATGTWQLTWSNAVDNKAVVAYKVYENGSYLATVTENTFTVSGLIAGINYKYVVIAGDEIGNWTTSGPYVNVRLPLPSKGSIDKPAQSQSISGKYAVSGWMLDEYPISKVEVYIDGTYKGEATYGSVRNDVYNAYPIYNNFNSGFNYLLDTTKLTIGSHTMTVKGTNSFGGIITLAQKKFTVTPPARGVIDKPTAGQVISGIFNVSGWFLDGRTVKKVEVLVDDAILGQATYGKSRFDVFAVFPEYYNKNSGFTYALDTKKFTNGTHTITVKETALDGTTIKLPAKTVTFANLTPPKGIIEHPVAGDSLTGVANITGWFLDVKGVSKLNVYVDGEFFGEAEYGIARNDIFNLYTSYDNQNSGFTFALDTTLVPDGTHTIEIEEINSAGEVKSIFLENVIIANSIL